MLPSVPHKDSFFFFLKNLGFRFRLEEKCSLKIPTDSRRINLRQFTKLHSHPFNRYWKKHANSVSRVGDNFLTPVAAVIENTSKCDSLLREFPAYYCNARIILQDRL